jgi:Tol biopolymer transport system component
LDKRRAAVIRRRGRSGTQYYADESGWHGQPRNSTGATDPKFPSLTSDNRYLVYADKKGQELNIWRFGMADGALAQISLRYAVTPALAPDDQSIVYATMLGGAANNKLTVHRKPLDGGEETSLSSATSVRPAVSPTGRFVACNYAGEETGKSWQIAILPSATNNAATRFIKPYAKSFFRNPQERPARLVARRTFSVFLKQLEQRRQHFSCCCHGRFASRANDAFYFGRNFRFCARARRQKRRHCPRLDFERCRDIQKLEMISRRFYCGLNFL